MTDEGLRDLGLTQLAILCERALYDQTLSTDVRHVAGEFHDEWTNLPSLMEGRPQDEVKLLESALKMRMVDCLLLYKSPRIPIAR